MKCVESITVTPSSVTLNIGEWCYAKAEVEPADATCNGVTWYSGNTRVATVNASTGYIYAKAAGTARIYAEAEDGCGASDYIKVIVKSIPVTSVTVIPSNISMLVGEKSCLSAIVYPSNASDTSVVWESNDEDIVSVNSHGEIVAKSIGTATVTATTNSGGYFASAVVSVRRLMIYQTARTYIEDEYGKEPEDISCNTYTEEELKAMDWINWSDFVLDTPEGFRSVWEDPCTSMFAVGELRDVLLDMVDSFMDGSGKDYSNSILTKKVQEHESTITYINSVKNCISNLMATYDGDITKLKYTASSRDTNPLVNSMKNASIYQPVYDTLADYTNGLVLCLHGLWGNHIEVTSFERNGNNYSGTLDITLYDHFGLDQEDIQKFGFLAGLRAWYILQHNKAYNGAYKPFTTFMRISIPFSGTI